MKRLLTLCAMMSLSLSGCTYTSAVSQTNFPANRTKPVHAMVEKFIVLGFNFDNDYALQLTSKLKDACPQGDIRGVTTHDQIVVYFGPFLWARKVQAEGYCLPHRAMADLEPAVGDVASSQE